MKTIIVICGTTATGKTSLALSLCKKVCSSIISADSRQIYVGMDIGTGKEDSKDHHIEKYSGRWRIEGTDVYGYDVVQPDQEFSIAHYNAYVHQQVLPVLEMRNELPVIVGGTGLYIKSCIDGLDTLHIPPDTILREQLERIGKEKGAGELEKILREIDQEKAEMIDKHNPRRIIRAIEIARHDSRESQNTHPGVNAVSIWIGLRMPRDKLYERIDARVDAMMQRGLVQEIQALLAKGYSWGSQALSGIGYRQFRPYLEEDKDLNECVQRLKFDTHAYARRQETWFKKEKRITWFDISETCEVDIRDFIISQLDTKTHSQYVL